MGRKRVYIRVWKDGPTEEEQRETLQSAGVIDSRGETAVYIDAPSVRQMQKGALALTDRENCIRDMRLRPEGEEPDELVVCAPWVLAVSAADLFAVAARIAEKGAFIHDLSSGKRVRWLPEVAGIADMASAVTRFQGRRKTEKARLTAALSEKRKGPKPKLTGRLLDLFLADWGDARAGTNAEVAARHGIGVQTAHRLAGMPRMEAIRRAERAKYDRMEPETMPSKRGRRPNPKP